MDSPSINRPTNISNDNSTSQSPSSVSAETSGTKPRAVQSQKVLKLRVSGSHRVICLSHWGLGNAGSQGK